MGPSARIDLSALRHNLSQAAAAAPHSKVLAVIKADGYGHGMPRVARALGLADAFGVARVEEGVALRQAGIRKPVAVLEGCFDRDELAAASHHGLALVLHSPYQLDLLAQSELPLPVHCWVKVDSGMHRLGFHPERVLATVERLRQLPSVAAPLRLMTHFASADDPADTTTRRQMEAFLPLMKSTGLEASMANSAGILAWPESRREWVRPGIMLYGASPMLAGRAGDHGLRPVMTLRSRLIAVNHFRRGDAVGYGGTWRCPEEMPVGVVAVGYGDGYPRHLPSGTPVLVNGERQPLIGRVSMDMISVDLRGQPAAKPGDPVVLWGNGLPAELIAEAAGTIPYTLFCGVTPRVARDVVGEE